MSRNRFQATMGVMVLALLAAGVARADGTGGDPVLKMGGGTGSPNCISAGNFSFQTTTGSDGTITPLVNGSCVNNGPTDITKYSFDILIGNAPGGITPILDNLLAPFASNPWLSTLDWTASCAVSGGIDICTAMQSSLVASVENTLCATYFATLCSQLSSLSATQMEAADPWAFTNYQNNPCLDPFVYVIFGIIPGCDISVSTVTGGGVFAGNSLFDLAPAGVTATSLPEPSSLSLMLLGLTGLPFFRRKLIR